MSIFKDFAKIAAAVAEEALATGIDAFETKREQVGRKLDEKATKAATVINAKREQLEDVVAGVVTTVELLLTDLDQQFNPRAQQKVEPTTTLDKPVFQAPKEEAVAAPVAKEEKAAPKAAAKKPAAKKAAAPKAPK
ncbi:MAG: hypothetical protein PSY14_14800 [bacterium]|nr:hypothetical protein [bacterium]